VAAAVFRIRPPADFLRDVQGLQEQNEEISRNDTGSFMVMTAFDPDCREVPVFSVRNT
jgi:hypothetical protein